FDGPAAEGASQELSGGQELAPSALDPEEPSGDESSEDEPSEDELSGGELARQREPAQEPPLPDDMRTFMWHYRALLRAAYHLIGGPQFDRLSRLYDRIGAELKPSGPPESPVYESYAIQHILADVPVGLARETPYSVLARLIQNDPARQAFLGLARSLADSHHDLYRVLSVQGTHAQLKLLRDGRELAVRTISDFLRAGDLLLARIASFEGNSYLADAPYLLQASDEQWLLYLTRIAEQATEAASSARQARPTQLARLTPKQRARLRQQRKQAEQAQTPDNVILRHLKFGSSERFWLDFIVDSYADQRDGIACLAGVPDQLQDASEPSYEDESSDEG
ncbi:MAG: hypothetical protein RL685_6427, partial [Pseudomonadota bacterium]